MENTIVWSNFGMTVEMFQKEIEKMPESQCLNIEELLISNNQLPALPAGISRFSNLRSLRGFCNILTVIPPQVFSLNSLTILNLEGNKLTHVPAEIAKLPNLIRLHLADNKIVSVSSRIISLGKLEQLFLARNPLPNGLDRNGYDAPATQQLVVDVGAHFRRHENCRSAVINLLCIWQYRRPFFALGRLTSAGVQQLAQYLYSTRNEECWNAKTASNAESLEVEYLKKKVEMLSQLVSQQNQLFGSAPPSGADKDVTGGSNSNSNNAAARRPADNNAQQQQRGNTKRSKMDMVKLFLGKIGPSAPEEEVRQMFEPYGPVGEVVLIRSGAKKFGFVHIDNDMAANAIAALNGKVRLSGSDEFLVVRFADTEPRNTHNQAQAFGQAYGGYQRGGAQMYGGAEYGNFYGQQAANPYGGQQQQYFQQQAGFGGAYGAGNFPPQQRAAVPSVPQSARGPIGANLFVLGFPDGTEDAHLMSWFSPYGTVLSANVFRDKMTGMKKNFGFVSYDDPNAAGAALNALNGVDINGHKLRISLKEQK